MSEIQLKNITKRYGQNTVISGLNLDIAAKEFLVLLGPSGCGKTTLMRMVAGLEDITGGDIFIGGRRVNDLTPRARGVSMVFQNYSLYPHMTVEDNLAYPLLIEGVSKQKRKDMAEGVSRMVELDQLLQRYPSQLSGGQRQRVALGRAIIKEENEIFLMDEPLSNLDALLRHSMRAQIKNLHYRLQKTTIYVTHDQVEAMTMASRIVVLNKGVVQQVGTPEEIYENPANIFVASFIGSPPMNIIYGNIEESSFTIGESRFPLSRPVSAGSIYLGLRPERVRPVPVSQGMLKGKIYAIEFLGESILIHAEIAPSVYFICKASKADVAALENRDIDSSIGFTFDPESIYLFDSGTQAAL